MRSERTLTFRTTELCLSLTSLPHAMTVSCSRMWLRGLGVLWAWVGEGGINGRVGIGCVCMCLCVGGCFFSLGGGVGTYVLSLEGGFCFFVRLKKERNWCGCCIWVMYAPLHLYQHHSIPPPHPPTLHQAHQHPPTLQQARQHGGARDY